MERSADAVIIGGGSTGSSILFHLAKGGETNSILIEKGQQIASGQTSRSSGIVRTHYRNPIVAKMALLSLKFFQQFEKEVGSDCGFRETGLLLGADARSADSLAENIVLLKELGINTKLVDKDEARRIEPELGAEEFTSIAYEPNTGYAEPSLTASAFAESAQKLGATVLTDCEATGIERNSTKDYSVTTSAGTIRTPTIVIATGIWSKKLFEKLRVRVPLKPVRATVVIFQRPERYKGVRPVLFDLKRMAYYKPEGQYRLEASSLDLEFFSSEEVDPDSIKEDIAYDEIAGVSEWVSEAVPIMRREGVFQRAYTGVYDKTPDDQPVIDELSEDGYEGIHCLVGLSGHGFKLCPEFGRIMGETIINGRFTDYDISIFRRSRFDEGKLIKSAYQAGTIF